MRGFQPGKARAVPQNYADGGVVSTIKGMLGFGGGKKKPEPLPADLSKMPPTGAGPAASQPEQPKKAISGSISRSFACVFAMAASISLSPSGSEGSFLNVLIRARFAPAAASR